MKKGKLCVCELFLLVFSSGNIKERKLIYYRIDCELNKENNIIKEKFLFPINGNCILKKGKRIKKK